MNEQKVHGAWAAVKEFAVIFIVALVIALVVKAFIMDTRIVPTLSMYPTVNANDRVIVNKLAYLFGQPQTGDIIVFSPPAELNMKDDLLKRVIGTPGDVIEVANNTVFVNGIALTEDYLNQKPNYQYGPVTVPEDHLFVLGDNRNDSIDSHLWSNPFIEIDVVKGKAFLCYWPFSSFGSLYK